MVRQYIEVDTPYTATTESLAFKVEDSDGNVVWQGVARPFPGESAVTIWVNRLVSDFLGSGWAPATGVTSDESSCRTFYLKDGEGTLLETFVFVDGDGTLQEGLFSEPVNGHLDPRMMMPVTNYSVSGTTITIESDD